MNISSVKCSSFRSHRPSSISWHLHYYLSKLAMLLNLAVSLSFLSVNIKNTPFGASLVAQWLRICLLMQGTRVRVLVWEDPTCRGATRPVSHNYWACASGACAPQREEAAIVRGPRAAMKRGPRLPQLEEALAQKRRPNTAK